MLGRRRVFTLQPLSRQDGGCEELLGGCVVLGVKSIYLQVHDMPGVPSTELQDGDCMVRGSRERTSRDSGVEMGGGENPPTTYPGFALNSSSLEPGETPKLAPLTKEPPADLDRVLASQKLQQVVSRSCWPRSSSITVPKGWQQSEQQSKQEQEVSPEITGDHCGTMAGVGLQPSPTESLVVGSESDAWACLPGQGLRYLEYLCLMLERMATLQQLHVQLQEQYQQMPTGMEETNENSVLAPFHPQYSSMLCPQEFQSPMEKTMEELALPRRAEVHSVSTPNLLEGAAEDAHTIPSCRGHRNTLSHWNKVKALLNRIRWKSPHGLESSLAQDPSGPRRDSEEPPETPLHYPQRRTFMPSLVSKKHRAKNFLVC